MRRKMKEELRRKLNMGEMTRERELNKEMMGWIEKNVMS
jgi:hypothetical protein